MTKLDLVRLAINAPKQGGRGVWKVPAKASLWDIFLASMLRGFISAAGRRR